MSTKTDMRITISRKGDSTFTMAEVNPETSPAKYRVLHEMAGAGEIEIMCKSKSRRLWEIRATKDLVIPSAHLVKDNSLHGWRTVWPEYFSPPI